MSDPQRHTPLSSSQEPSVSVESTQTHHGSDSSRQEFGTTLSPESHTTLSPRDTQMQSIAGYEVLSELGRGGMGVVYKARQKGLGRLVALKMILHVDHAGSEERLRFQREAEALAQLKHEHIVQIFEVGEVDGKPFISLEYVEGGSLARRLNGTPLPVREAVAMAEQLALAIAAAHGAGVVHRDLKPANVLLAADGTPKVVDFGLALRLDLDDRQTRTGAVMGTPAYMAPEQALGLTRRVGPAADVYALGAILYEMLTGRPPFKAATVLETLDLVRHQEAVSPRRLNPQVPRDLETVCLKCLRKEPEKRYAGARELAYDLAQFREGRPVLARPVGRLESTTKWVQRNPLVSALTALIVVSVLVGLAAFAWQFQKAVLNEQFAVKKAEDATTAEEQALNEKAEATKQTQLAEKRAEALRVALEDKELALSASERARSNGSLARAEQSWRAGNSRIARELIDDVPKAFRGWAWNHLEREIQGGLFTAYGNRGPVHDLAFSSDGSLLAAVDQAETANHVEHVCVWDASTGVELPSFRGGFAGRNFVAFSPDNRYLLTHQPLAAGWSVRKWDVANGRPSPGPPEWAAGRSWFPTVSPDGKRLAGVDQTGEVRIYGPNGPALTCAGGRPGGSFRRPVFSPDGSLLALAVHNGKVCVWNTTSGQLVQTLTTGKAQPDTVAFSPDGRLLAVGNVRPGGVWIWDTRTWEARPQVWEFNALVLAFSPDGEWLAVAVRDGIILILDARTGAEVGKLRGLPSSTARALVFSPDGQRLAVGAWDHSVRIWDLRSLVVPPLDPKARPVAAAPDGEFTRAAVLTGDNRLRVLDIASGVEMLQIRAIKDLAESVIALSPDGKRLAFSPRPGFFGQDVVLVRSVPDNQSLRLVRLPAYADQIVFSPDAAELSVISPTNGPKRGILRADLTSDGQTIWEGSGERWGVGSLAYSPDGRYFVAGFADGKIRVWDRKSGRLEGTLLGHWDRVNCLAFSPDSRNLVSGGRSDRSIIVWDFPALRQRLRLSGHEKGVAEVALSPDGQVIASLGVDGRINLWDGINRQQMLTLDGPQDLQKIHFSRDGNRLLGMTSSGEVVQWQGAPAPFRQTLRGHDNKINAIGFSPDGQILASFAIQLKWWDVASGRDLFSGEHLGQAATALAFRPDCRQLGFVTIQNTVQVWDVAEKKKLADFDAKVLLWGLAFSPEQGVLATWDDNKGLAVWEFPVVRQRFRVSVSTAGFPELAFSSDGKLVTVTDALDRRTAFDSVTGKSVSTPLDFRPAISPASPVSPDGSLFALPVYDELHLVTLRPDAQELERRRVATRVDLGWQDRQATRHEIAKNWFAAVTHLNAILRERPGDDAIKERQAKAVAALAELDKK